MTDALYILLTLVAFAFMALLIGVLTRRLDDQQPGGDR